MVPGWPATQQARQLSHTCILLAAAQFLRHVLEWGLVLSLEQDRGALCGRVFQAVALALWQAHVLGSCPAGGSGYSDVASGHLAVTWSGHGQQPVGLALFSFSSFFQNTNSAPGGPKSWAQLNGKPAGHEGGK